MKRLARVASFAAAAIAWLAALIVLAWGIGRVCTDRFIWTQWLWWIPTPALLPVILIGGLAALRPAERTRRRRRVMKWAVGGLALLVYFSAVEHRIFHGVRAVMQARALKIVHWNVEPAVWTNVEPSVEQLVRFDADITILTNPGGILLHERTRAWLGEARAALTTRGFAIISRVPVRTIRPVIAVDDIFVSVIEFEAGEIVNAPLTMYLVDLPSDPALGRMATAKRVRRMLDDLRLPPPDVVVGDFNAPRGSASISLMFPNLRHAFDEGGHGYGATYFRPWPLYHLDHTLLGEPMTALRYDIVDPGISRHRAQVTWLKPDRK